MFDKDTLKPCPFCGGPAEMHEMPHYPTGKHIQTGTDYIPRCKDTSCPGRATKRYSVKETAIFKWNRRVQK